MTGYGCGCGSKPPKVTSAKGAQQIAGGEADSQSQGS